MSILFKHLRVYQIFGANTDVGKTILTAALVRASASRNNTVFYLKPISTGPSEDADDRYDIMSVVDKPISFVGRTAMFAVLRVLISILYTRTASFVMQSQ